MKRNENKVPPFDDIIFENRNKEYGAYYLRKHYKSATGISILGALVFSSVIAFLLSMMPEKGTASEPSGPIVILTVDDYKPEAIQNQEVKPPAELFKPSRNLVPVVTEDTALATELIPATDELTSIVTDGNVNDTATLIMIMENIIEPEIPAEPEVHIFVKEMPEYPGGQQELLDFIAKNTKYPEEAIRNNIQGKVTLKFVVNVDGSVGRIEVLRGVDSLLDHEAIRVVSTLPKFRPGKQNGIPVPVWFMVPVNFQLKYY